MLNFLSTLLVINILLFVGLFTYKQFLECKLIKTKLPKPKKKIVIKKVNDEE